MDTSKPHKLFIPSRTHDQDLKGEILSTGEYKHLTIPAADEAGIKPPPPEQRKVLTIADLTHQCNDAASKMGNNNPHKSLLLNCAAAMQQLVQRLEYHESKVVPQ